MKAVIGLHHRRPVVEPELRIGLAEADRVGAHHELGVAESSQRLFVELCALRKVAHRDRDVVDHGAPIPRNTLVSKMGGVEKAGIIRKICEPITKARAVAEPDLPLPFCSLNSNSAWIRRGSFNGRSTEATRTKSDRYHAC